MKTWILAFAMVAVLFTAAMAKTSTDGIITKEELRKILDDPDLVILDVRTGRDWRSSEFKIKGALRASPSKFNQWITLYDKGKRFVTYCA